MAFRDDLKKYRESQSKNTSTTSSTTKTTQPTTSGSTGSGSSGSFKDWLKEYRETASTISLEGWAESSSSLINDVRLNSNRWYDDNEYQSRYERFTNLLSQADNWRKQYAGNSEAVSYIDSVVDTLSKAKDYSNSYRKFYAQWETAEDYDGFVAQQEEYEAKKNFDISAGEKEIEELKKRREKLTYESNTTQPGSTYLSGSPSYATSPYAASQQGGVYNKEAAELDALISQKTAYLNQAKHIQEGIALAGVVDNVDFDANNDYVSTEADDWWSRLTANTYDETYEYINNQNGKRDEIKHNYRIYSRDNPWSDGESIYEEKGYDYLKENEIAIYNYYYAKEGKKAAEKYLDSIQETLNNRKATGMYENMEDKTLLELAFGVAAGLDQFESGVKNLFNTQDDYIPATATQIASGMVREDLADDGPKLPDWLGGASLGQVGYDAITTTANMAPSMLSSIAANMVVPGSGAIVGNTLMFASSAGNAYQEALNLGYDKGQARAYSTLVGASEAGLQYLLGGIGSLGGKASGAALSKMLDGIDNAFARTALKLGGNMLSEGFEEGLQEVLTPLFKNWTLRAGENINWSEVAYSGLLGALTAGFMEGPTTIAGEVKTYQTGKSLQAADISAVRLAEIGKTFSADTVAYQLAGRVNENTGAYTMGRLFNEIGATLSEQNVTEITNALVAKGMDEKTARKNAEALAYVVEGGQLSERQIAAIEANDVLAEVARTTLIDANTTWNQRSQGYNEVLKALADEMASPKASRTKAAQQGKENTPAADMVDARTENGTEVLSEADSVDTSPAKVQSISAIKNGQATIKLEDGSEVDVKKADLDPDDGVRIETIASIEGITASDANSVLNTLRTSTNASAQMDSLGAKEAYKYGFYGLSQEHLTKHGVFANSLTDTQRQAIYEIGRKARQHQIENASLKRGTGRQTEIYFDAGSGKVEKFTNSKKMSTMTDKQKAGVQAAMILRKLGIGGDIYFFESYRNSKGQLVYKDKHGNEVKAPNGWYEQDGSIHIDLNAGTKGQGFILFTLAHELTHFIEQWSPQKYKILADFLVENYEKGQSMDKLVRAKQAKLSALRGEKVSYKEAYSEVIADSMEAMLADGNVMEKLIELKVKDNSLFMKMKQFFDNLLAKIRNIYKGQTPDSAEGRAVLEMTDSIEKIQQLFADALVEASENFQTAEKNTTQEGGVQMMVRENVIDVNGKVYNKVVKPGLTVYDKVKHSKKSYVAYLQSKIYPRTFNLSSFEGPSIMVEFAKQNERLKKDGDKSPRRALGELEATDDRLKMIAIINIKDLLKNSEPLTPSNENSHQWLDAGGWRDRISYMSDHDVVYPVILHIPKTRDGRYLLYDVSVIKEEGSTVDIDATALAAQSARASDTKEDGVRSAVKSVDPSAEMVTQPEEEVKSESVETLADSGIAVDSETDAGSIFSVRDVLDDTGREKVAAALVDRFGVTKEEAMKWLTAETSLASLILNPKYSSYLDYAADPSELAIKQNSDYPQGTVDFSNICKKRREFTQVMNRILRNFPNHVFAATDLAKIRTIMGEEGMTLPCGICYVEDRRQLDTIVAQDFIDGLKLYREGSKTRPDGKPFNANQLKGLQLTDGDTYVPTIYELVSLEGRNSLKAKNPNMEAAWVRYNNARGMQSVRLLTNEAEYKRQILKYTKNTVQSKNDKGGLRIYSFSDAEMFHLIDIIQVITDSAAVGLYLQGYTKVNEYAKAVKDTGEKLNRSLIPLGDLGYHIENGKVVLDYDTVEGIDIYHEDFFDNKDNPNVGNITIGINDIQIRAAMVSDFVDQIIPFHTGQSEEVLGEKGIAAWNNYKDFQTEKDLATGKTSSHQVNIYTEVFQAAEKEGKPIQNKRQFVEKFLQVCKENDLQPRFSQFLNTDAQGNYIYTEGYHKFLVDFKTFAQTEVGEYLPQGPVKPVFDNGYISGLLKAYVKEQQAKDADVAKQMPKVIERITNEIIKPAETEQYVEAVEISDANTQWSLREEEPPKKTKVGYKAFFVKDGKLYPPMVANPSGAGTPVGVWLNADTGSPMRDSEGNIVQNQSGRAKVAAGGKGTKGGGGSLAWRPGWHLGPIPDATQFSVDPASKEWSEWLKKTGKTAGETKNIGNKGNPIFLNPHIVFAEVEFAADVDYQLEAYEYGVNKKGKFDHSQAGIPYVIKDGYYRYRTNSMAPGALSWYITGSMKVNRILTDAECRKLCAKAGREMMPRLGGDFDFASHNLTAGDVTPTEDLSSVAPKQDFSDEVLKLPGYVRRKLDFSDPNFRKAFEDDSIADKLEYYENLYNETDAKKFSDRDSDGNQLSAEQQEFFKDSKVRDEQGRLIPMYHGTNNPDFTVFDPRKSDDHISLFFTSDPDVANTYTHLQDKGRDVDPYNLITNASTAEQFNKAQERVGGGLRVVKITPEWVQEMKKQAEKSSTRLLGVANKYADLLESMNESRIFNYDIDRIREVTGSGTRILKGSEISKLRSAMGSAKDHLFFVKDKRTREVSKIYIDTYKLFDEAGNYAIAASTNKSEIGLYTYTETNSSVPFRMGDLYPGSEKGMVAKAIDRMKWVEEHHLGNRYKVYLNITNPYILDAGEDYSGVKKKVILEYDYRDGEWTVTLDDDTFTFDRDGFDDFALNAFDDKTYGEIQAQIQDDNDADSNGWDDDAYGRYVDHYIKLKNVSVNYVAPGNWNDLQDHDVSIYMGYDDGASLKTRDITRYAYDNGYDGVIFKNMKDAGGYAFMKGRGGSTVVTAFSSEQVKSVDNKKPTTDPDIRYSDRDYMDAVNRGDMETVQRMVDEAAKAAGYTTKAYHGTRSEFTKFDIGRGGANYDGWSQFGKGLYFSKTVNGAEHWASMARGLGKMRVMPTYLRLSNPLVISPHSELPADARAAMEAVDWEASWYDIAKPLGYDGIVKEGYESDDFTNTYIFQYVVFDANQIKSADPVTYDDNGNVIPLSQRFNPENDDIRYSERVTDSVSNRSLLANAFESVAQNDIERQKIQEYKGKISLINSEEQKLSELNEKIKELSFSKGPRDTKAIRDLQFEARQTANRINTYDKQLLRLEASKPLQDVLTREKKMAYKRAEQKGKEALEAYRERATKTQRDLLDKWQTSRKKGIDSRHRTAMRHKIKDVVNELNQYLLRGTKERHVPIELQKAVAEALDAVNMDTVGAEERIAKLQDELLKAKTPEQIQEISRKIDHIQEMGERMNGKLQKLKDAYDQFVNSDDPLIANSHDEVISNKLQSVIETVGDTPLRDMTLSQLEDVYDMYRMVLTTIRNANKAFKAKKSESISVIANQVMVEVEKVGGKKQLAMKGMDGIKSFMWNNLKPVYAFEHIGSDHFTEVFNNVRDGEDVWALDVTEAREFYLDKSKKHNYDSWDFKKRYNFTSTSGMIFELNLEQIMSLYAYSKRDQAADHLKKGGIVIDETTEITVKNKLGIPVKFNPTEATAYNISEETLADIISKLTDEQKAFADEMQDYLSTVMGAKGNEVSLVMYGVKLFKEKFYFPLKSAHQFMAKAKEQAQGDVKIKNSGFSKETVQKASNPIVLTPFMNVWANHVNEMSMYHAFVLPMEDFYRVYNYKTPTSDTMATESVEMFIQNAYGKGATKYIDQLLKDLNGGARTDSTTGIINKMTGLFKKGAVFASLSVVVQQPSAIARAAALVDTKYFIGPKVDHKRHKALWDEVKRYAPVAIIKEMGYFDTNMGKSTQDFILGKEYSGFAEKMKALVTDSGYRDEVLSKAPALADELAWCSIWEAVKRETKAKYPGLDTKAEPFLKLCGSRFTEVIVKTQVYDSALSRSALMRSKDTGMKMATAFMAEPTTSINMVADALLKGKRGDRKYARAAIGAVIASQILNSILVSFVYAGRDDDEDETCLEKYIGTLSGEILDSLNPAGYIPFIKDIMSIVQGYDVERSDMAVISDLWTAWQNLSKDNVSTYRKVEGFAGSIAQIFGLPVKNIMRDARGIYQTINSFVNGQQTTKAGIGYAVKGAVTGKDVTNQQQLYEAYMSGDKTQIARVEGRYESQTAINSAIRKALRENDPRIHDAAVARSNGNISEYTRIAKSIIAEGHFSQDNVVAAINAEINAMAKGETTSSNPKASGLYKAEDFALAISQGDSAMANAIKTDIIQTAQKNGKTAEEAEKSFVSSAKGDLKELYIAGSVTEAQAIDALTTYCGDALEDAEKRVSEWGFEQDYGFSWSDRADAYKSGKISAQELQDILVNVGGKTDEEAMWQVKVYDWQNEGFDIDSNQKSVVEDYETYCEPAGIDKNTYFDAYLFYADAGEEGVAYSKTIECMPYIDSLPLSSSQKTALALCWWAKSTVNKYKTW